MAKKTKDNSEDEKRPLREVVIEELKFIAGLAAFLFMFFNFVFGHYKIPSESMQPTLEVGDHLYVNKFAYGFSKHSLVLWMHKLPFLKDGRVFGKMPKHGDVAVFRNPKSGMVMIKRVVGLPGDKIETQRGRLYVNGALIERTLVDEFSYREHRGYVAEVARYDEQLPNEKQKHQVYERSDFDRLDNRGALYYSAGQDIFHGR